MRPTPDGLTTRRVWLHGAQTGRCALVLSFAMAESITGMLASYADALARDPWLDGWPVVLGSVTSTRLTPWPPSRLGPNYPAAWPTTVRGVSLPFSGSLVIEPADAADCSTRMPSAGR